MGGVRERRDRSGLAFESAAAEFTASGQSIIMDEVALICVLTSTAGVIAWVVDLVAFLKATCTAGFD
jgi:hypothetical protein